MYNSTFSAYINELVATLEETINRIDTNKLEKMTEQKLTGGIRFATMILDHFIMTMIAMVFFIPGMISGFTDAFNVTHEQTNLNIFGGFNYFALIGFAIYFCKDSINGRSIAKRILKLQLVDNSTGQIASPLKCFVRNLFIILWPIELIVALVNPSRRIGDRVAGTKLIPFDSTLEQPSINYGQIAISLGLSYVLIFLVMLPFNNMQSKNASHKINFVESSYNEQESKAIEKIYADSLGNNLTADVKVYDKIENENFKYVSIIYQLKENYFENESSYEKLISTTASLLYTILPEKTFVGQLKFVYRTEGSIQTRTLPIDWRQEKNKGSL